MRNLNIPIGFASKLGVYSASVLAIAALVTAVLNGDHSEATLTTLAGAVITLVTTLAGRFAQAYAILRSDQSIQGAVDALDVVNAPLDEGDDPRTPLGLGR
jgi:hypothetical protein